MFIVSAGDSTLKSLEMVRIEPGTFWMGSPEDESDRDREEAQHRVTITRAFEIGKYEVTQALWKDIMGNSPSQFKDCGDCPVEYVNWYDVQDFLLKLNERYPAENYRLPTEAEWEYVCRAGTEGAYSGSPDTMAWYKDNSDGHPHPVGQKKPNQWGLYDMHGNVWEWCSDWYGAYPVGEVRDPAGPDSGLYRVNRGGSFAGGVTGCRSAGRDFDTPKDSSGIIGFRLARSL